MTEWIYPNCKCTYVVDGDTMDMMIDHGCDIFSKKRIRLAGIDAAESYGKNRTELGVQAKAYVKELLEGKYFTLISKEKDGKYGRLIADIVINPAGELLSNHLVDLGYAEYINY